MRCSWLPSLRGRPRARRRRCWKHRRRHLLLAGNVPIPTNRGCILLAQPDRGQLPTRWRRDPPSILPAARRDRDRHESCPEARRPRWAIRIVIAILGGVWRPTQVGSDQPDWIRRSGSSPGRRLQHDHHAARSIRPLFPSSGSLPNTSLAPICDAWASLPDRSQVDHLPSPRDDFGLIIFTGDLNVARLHRQHFTTLSRALVSLN